MRERIEVAGDDEYRLEIEDFAGCVATGSQPAVVSHEDTLANMATIDALYESARTGVLSALKGLRSQRLTSISLPA